ncbi:MAG: DUF4430 domain-containing protein [Clostridia bacterium]|nr:DUF4430 domain-containing protein [Clostridia bacterium]
MKRILPYLLILGILLSFACCGKKQRGGTPERTLYTTLTPTSAPPTTIPPAAYSTAPMPIPTGAVSTAQTTVPVISTDTTLPTTTAATTAESTVFPTTQPTSAQTTVPTTDGIATVPTTTLPDTTAATTQGKTACTFSVECAKALSDVSLSRWLPEDGMIFSAKSIEFTEGESVFDVLQRVCRENNIPMEFSMAPIYNTAYIEGIGGLYEFDGGSMSGWMYSVNGVYPNYGCSKYQLKNGDVVEWHYTMDLGEDLGAKDVEQS